MTPGPRRARPVSSEFLSAFQLKLAGGKVPVAGSLALTHRCNLRCVHCYLGDRRDGVGGGRELDTARWLSLVDEAADAGCLDLLITGGEPLLRRDFGEVYRRARERGMLVTVFTNGTVVDDEHLALFGDLPPVGVEVTIYGATEETYERVTGVRGSYGRCMAGVERLHRLGLHLTLKTVLLTVNFHEFAAVEALAKGFGTEFRYDPVIYPRFDGKGDAGALRVDPRDVAAAEFADPERAQRWCGYAERHRNLPAVEGPLLCGAGVTYFHLDPDGTMQGCMMLREPAASVARRGFRQGWGEVTAAMALKTAAMKNSCGGCERRYLCGFCPALFEIEGGAADSPSDFACRIGSCRLAAIAEASGN